MVDNVRKLNRRERDELASLKDVKSREVEENYEGTTNSIIGSTRTDTRQQIKSSCETLKNDHDQDVHAQPQQLSTIHALEIFVKSATDTPRLVSPVTLKTRKLNLNSLPGAPLESPSTTAAANLHDFLMSVASH